MGMSEAEMAAADPKVLAAKVKAAADILYQVIAGGGSRDGGASG